MKRPERIITFGLTAEQERIVAGNLPTRDYELLSAAVPTDLIAINCTAAVVSGIALDDKDVGMLFDYYRQVDGCLDETVLWFGDPVPPREIQTILKCYDSFEDLEGKLKYLLLTAHSRKKKAVDYSAKLVIGLKILSLIRKRPGITTLELADKVSIPVRSVQRTIAALQAAGEWIEYDRSLRGWKLFHGVSVLFGDVWE